MRITVGYERINAASIVGRDLLPGIDDLIDPLSSCNVYSILDLTRLFFQLTIGPNSVDLTVSITP